MILGVYNGCTNAPTTQTAVRRNQRVDLPHLHERHNSVHKAVYDFEACGGAHVSSHQAAAVPRAGVAGVVAKHDIRNLEKPYAVLDLKALRRSRDSQNAQQATPRHGDDELALIGAVKP